jgi:hypothetical protein
MGLLLKTAAIDERRKNHYVKNPATGLYEKTLLLEGPATNLLFNSTPQPNSPWSREGGANTTVTLNAALAPDGTWTASRVEWVDGYYYSRCHDLTTETFTFSVWIRRGPTAPSDSTFRIMMWDYTNGGNPVAKTDPVALTDEWQRISTTYVAPSIPGSLGAMLYHTNNGNSILYGNASDVYVWGAQLEQGRLASSYIATQGSPVSRTRDSLLIPFLATGKQSFSVYARLFALAQTDILRIGGYPGPYLWIYKYGTTHRCILPSGVGRHTPRTFDSAPLEPGTLVEVYATQGEDGGGEFIEVHDGVEYTSGYAGTAPLREFNNPNLELCPNNGSNAFTHFHMEPGIRTLAEMRNKAGVN